MLLLVDNQKQCDVGVLLPAPPTALATSFRFLLGLGLRGFLVYCTNTSSLWTELDLD